MLAAYALIASLVLPICNAPLPLPADGSRASQVVQKTDLKSIDSIFSEFSSVARITSRRDLASAFAPLSSGTIVYHIATLEIHDSDETYFVADEPSAFTRRGDSGRVIVFDLLSQRDATLSACPTFRKSAAGGFVIVRRGGVPPPWLRDVRILDVQVTP